MAIAANPVEVVAVNPDPALPERFQRHHLISAPGFLAVTSLDRLAAEALTARAHAERSRIPGHKKGGTLSYESIHRYAPACLALYHSEMLRAWLSGLVGEQVFPTADHDQSSCSLLYYDRPGDHIGWHYDHNFYRGRHFTVLLSLVNRGAGQGLSDGLLQRRRSGRTDVVPTPVNTLVLFEGARVWHRASPIGAGQDRIMLSMTFGTDPRVHPWKEAIRRAKDTAYFGPRVLFE